MQIEVKGKLSAVNQPYILDAVKKGIDDLPPLIRLSLSDNTVRIANRLVDIDPAEATRLARGWGDKTGDYTSGYYWQKTICMAQERRVNDEGEYAKSSKDLYKVFFHETGHAFDDPHSKGAPSASPAMIDAYDKDIRNLLGKAVLDQEKLIGAYSYFFSKKEFEKGAQKSESNARDEVFAEAFGNILGGFGHTDQDRDYARRHKELFANCYRIVEQAILTVDPDAKLYPNHRRYYPPQPRSHFENAVELAIKTNTALRSSFDSAAAAVNSTTLSANRTLAKIDAAVDNLATVGMGKLKIYGPVTACAMLLGCAAAPDLEAKFLPDTDACKTYKAEMMGGASMMKGIFTLPFLAAATAAGSQTAYRNAIALTGDFARNVRLLQSCKLA
jgi:hypothetical protein